MVTEDYISFETAKLLKEKGFDENTPVNYFVGDDKPRGCRPGEMIYHERAEEDTHLIACPTLQTAMKWLREVHNIFIGISVCERYENQMDDEPKVMFFFELLNLKEKQIIDGYFQEYVNTYEQACEAAIKCCLENLI